MLGTFSLTYGDKQINCVSNRSKLIWNILAYLICHRGEVVYTEDLISAVWDASKNANPSGAMRTAIFRARQMLAEAGFTTRWILTDTGFKEVKL